MVAPDAGAAAHRMPRAHPTEGHYLPLLVAADASFATDAARVVEGGMTHGVLSMDSFAFGLAEGALD
jgi:4,5-DOPA dioxygenase extradiol